MNQYIGKTLGAYQILEQIGQGGMATIFKAYQPAMDRYVAVKILPAHFTEDETFVERFNQEARTLARLEHPYILPVHTFGEQQGITYLVMRYIDAGTLKDLIARQGPLGLNEATRILDQVGSALGYAHSQGVIHRDIKPTNVLIDPRGDAFLTDFGIAKLVAGTAQFTATGAIVGTPAYMSPEQGLAETVDHRSDIYSLGVVLYEMVTGRVPYEAETPLAVLLKHVNDPLPPPRQIKPDLPGAVERVILKAVAKSPADRFQTAEEMVEKFRGAVAGAPTEIALSKPVIEPVQPTQRSASAPPPSQPTVVAPSPRRLPWLPIAGGVAALAALLIAALLILPNLGGDKTEATPTPERLLAQATIAPAATTGALATTTTPAATATPSPVPATPTPEIVSTSSGWMNYSNANFVFALARQDDYLWVGGEGGLVRWDLNEGSYVKSGAPDGLVSNHVNDLLVDEEGILWVATGAGISRFDGEIWLTFDEADGLDSNEVLALFEDDEGMLWAGSAYGDRGLNYYDGTGWGAPPLPPLPVEFPSPRVFLPDEEGGLLIGLDGQGLAYTDGDEWDMLTSQDGLPSDYVNDLLLTDDALWISFDSAVARIDLESDELEIVPQLEYSGISTMLQANDGSLWFGGDDGVTRYDPGTGDWQQFEPGTRTFPGWQVTTIVEDQDGLWLGTADGGVAFYDGTSWETWITDDRLGGNDVEAVLQDGSGALWFVHSGSGLTRYDPADDDWQTFGEQDGALDWPSRPGIDGDGYVWIGGYGELKWYDGTAWHTHTPAQLADVVINSIAFAPDGVRWLWTDAGLMRHDPATDEWRTFTSTDHPILENVNAFLVGSDGTLWVGGSDGLVGYDGESWHTPDANGDVPQYVSDVAVAPDGSLWVAADGALYHLHDGFWARFGWPDDGWVEQMAVGPDGSVWTSYDDLGRFDPSSGDWEIFTPDDGLIDSQVQAIYVTAEGVVWVGTAGGVSRYAPD
jgi:serine/threonine protein kinase/ligand-binding sensor domain-containing protein